MAVVRRGRVIREIRDREALRRLAISSPDASAAMLGATVAYVAVKRGSRVLLAGVERGVGMLRIFFSFGRSADGGPARLEGSCGEDVYREICLFLRRRYALAAITLRPWLETHRAFLAAALDGACGARIVSAVYPRLLVVPRLFEEYLGSISKKARNRYRYFLRHGGTVIEDDPLRHVHSIALVNLSSPYRQGARLPPSYLDPRLIARAAARWSWLRSRGAASFYLALVEGKPAGYAYIPHLNGHAYASRFLVHASYMRRGVGNGLLLEIIRDLAEKRKAYVFQYGYWRGANPGINRFLKQHGFRAAQEPVLVVSRLPRALQAFYGLWIDLSNRASPGPARLLRALERRAGPNDT